MEGWRIAVSTQTPLVRLGGGHGHGSAGGTAGSHEHAAGDRPRPGRPRGAAVAKGDGAVDPGLQAAGPGLVAPVLRHYDITPGGVSRMVLQSLRAWHGSGRLRQASWFSLQPAGPARMALEDLPVELHHLRLPGDEGQLQAYARTKEKLWADLHGLPSKPLGAEDFRHFVSYNHTTSDAILEHAADADAVYVHDFQLLQVGAMVGLAAPCVLRWHVPFDPARIPKYTRNFLLRMMESYDAVIVSTRRDLEGLGNSGFRGRVRQIYPHTDPADWKSPTATATAAFQDATRLPADAPVFLCVARMDPMKRQDLAIQALARLRRSHPKALLVLVGNGSFSGAKGTGLGLSKSARWRAHLEQLARDLRVADRVVFTGWMPDDQVAAAYARADAVVLPSDVEGFGLTPFEAWRFGKPCIVTAGCGAAEVVQDGVTGHSVPSGDAAALADAFERIARQPAQAQRMGEAGRIALRGFTAEAAADAEWAVLEDAQRRFRRQA